MVRSRLRDAAGSALRGFAMGSADVVPGVSGGTVALVTGIYVRLVTAVSTGSRALAQLARGNLSGCGSALKAVEWGFIGPLVLGAAAAVVTLARVIEDLLHDQPIRMAAVFLGLILGTIVVAWRILRRPEPRHAMAALGVGIVAFALFGLQTSTVTDPSLPVYFAAGALAICAFILPGISGSFLLLSIGMYQAVLGAVNDRDLVVIAAFGLGAVISLAAFSRLLERLLQRHHDAVTSVLIGLMIGSTRILWPWPNGLGDENGVGATVLGAPRGDVVVPLVLAAVAAVAVIALARWAERSTTADAATVAV